MSNLKVGELSHLIRCSIILKLLKSGNILKQEHVRVWNFLHWSDFNFIVRFLLFLALPLPRNDSHLNVLCLIDTC